MNIILAATRKIINYASLTLEPVKAKDTHQESIVAYWILFFLSAGMLSLMLYDLVARQFDLSLLIRTDQMQLVMPWIYIPLAASAGFMAFFVVFQFIIGRKVECPHCRGKVLPKQGWVCPQHHHENILHGKGLYWVFYHKCFYCHDDIVSFQCPFCRKYFGLTEESEKWDQQRLAMTAARPFMVRETQQEMIDRLKGSKQIAEVKNDYLKTNRRHGTERRRKNDSRTQYQKKENKWTSRTQQYEEAEKDLTAERKRKIHWIERQDISEKEKRELKEHWNDIFNNELTKAHNDIFGF